MHMLNEIASPISEKSYVCQVTSIQKDICGYKVNADMQHSQEFVAEGVSHER